MAISKEQIFAVADELDAAGQNPTLANVRKQLGSGSFTTTFQNTHESSATLYQGLHDPETEPAHRFMFVVFDPLSICSFPSQFRPERKTILLRNKDFGSHE